MQISLKFVSKGCVDNRHGTYKPGKVMEFRSCLEKSLNLMLAWKKNGILPWKVIENWWKSLKDRHFKINSLRPRPNRCHFADDSFKCIFENENEWISPRISLKFVPKVWINNIPALVHIMAWRRPGDKPLSEPMMVSLLTHICVTRPQWVKKLDIFHTWLSCVYWQWSLNG